MAKISGLNRKKMPKKSSRYLERNRKVAKARGLAWRKKLLDGEGLLGTLRAKVGLSQTKIAERLGVHRSTYGEIERGKRSIKTGLASKISEVLGTPKEKLFKKHSDSRYLLRT